MVLTDSQRENLRAKFSDSRISLSLTSDQEFEILAVTPQVLTFRGLPGSGSEAIENGMSRASAISALLWILLFPMEVSAEEEQAEQQKELVERLYNTGYVLTMLGQYEAALSFYQRSIEIQPPAEAYTFLGWTYSHMGDNERAIEEAEKAIRIDPDFGNPYNDIGVYLMEQGKDDDAIPYLKKAMRAKRYCCYQFPHFNLGRIYVKKKKYKEAIDEFKKSLERDPDYLPARQALEMLAESGVTPT
ncbi:MAG: tetratricopeptide repeat protein, partial [Rubricoccaceae bacterium]|nr:tetratricopeptide repeat protein [Rubricoccaceae bacterium]